MTQNTEFKNNRARRHQHRLINTQHFTVEVTNTHEANTSINMLSTKAIYSNNTHIFNNKKQLHSTIKSEDTKNEGELQC